jgi:hypothetical protein
VRVHAARPPEGRARELVAAGGRGTRDGHRGTRKWAAVARFVLTRTAKQCRERWFQRLAPEIRHGAFEPWEDAVILARQREFGNRWSLIAAKLPGRTPGSVKNRWYSGLKHKHATGAQLNLAGMGRDFTASQAAVGLGGGHAPDL